jgi:integrase
LHDAEVVEFLTHLAVNRHVSASTQNQALNALVFMYRHVIKHALGDITSTTRAKQPKKLPVVLTRHEVSLLLTSLNGIHRLIGSMLYGSGLRISECISLRIKDINCEYSCLHIHNAKGQRDSIVTLSPQLIAPLKTQVDVVRSIHAADLAAGYGHVYLPNALSRKYKSASQSIQWQYVFLPPI